MGLIHARGASAKALASLGVVVSLLLSSKLRVWFSQESAVDLVPDWSVGSLIVVELESIRCNERVIYQVVSHVTARLVELIQAREILVH